MRHQEPRETVVLEDIGAAPDCAGLVDSPDHESNTGVRDHDDTTLALSEKDGVG